MYDNEYLAHYGIKGMKWGVRRYQNKDGTLTPAGKKRSLMSDYKDTGSSKTLAKRHGMYERSEAKTLAKTAKSVDRLEKRDGDSKYTDKQRAKDYDRSIRGLQKLRDRQTTESYVDLEKISSNSNKIKNLQSKKQTDRRIAQIKKLTTDNELMELRLYEASDKYAKYNKAVDQLVNKMSNDKAVLYTTRRRAHANSYVNGNTYYTVSGTDYKVRSNTKSRAKSNTYSNPHKKKEYDNRVTRTEEYYYVY